MEEFDLVLSHHHLNAKVISSHKSSCWGNIYIIVQCWQMDLHICVKLGDCWGILFSDGSLHTCIEPCVVMFCHSFGETSVSQVGWSSYSLFPSCNGTLCSSVHVCVSAVSQLTLFATFVVVCSSCIVIVAFGGFGALLMILHLTQWWFLIQLCWC